MNSPPSLQNAVVYCPNISNLLIPGTFENSVITTQSLGITLFPKDCASFTAAGTQALFGSILNPFEIDFTTGQFVDTYNYDFFRTILVGQLILSSTLPLQIEQYEISPEHLNRWTTQSRTKYNFQPLITEYVVAGSCNPSVPLINLQFVVSPTMIITNINYQTILDLFSSLGALWTTGFGIIALGFAQCHTQEHKRKKKKRGRKIIEISPEQPPIQSPGDSSKVIGLELQGSSPGLPKGRLDDSPRKDPMIDAQERLVDVANRGKDN